MFRQGQLAVHGLAILLGRNEAGISKLGKIFCTTLYRTSSEQTSSFWVAPFSCRHCHAGNNAINYLRFCYVTAKVSKHDERRACMLQPTWAE